MRHITSLFALMAALASSGYAQSHYQYTVDLTQVVDDKVQVVLEVSGVKQDEVIFYLPKIVPGTYAVADYGRLVEKLQAYNKKGEPLEIERIETNGWRIKGARKLAKVTYWVNDSFDANLKEDPIFWPAGTNIEAGKNFVMNTSGFFGYFEDRKDVKFKFNIIRGREMYGSTGLIPVSQGEPLSSLRQEIPDGSDLKRVDKFVATDYDHLIDCPLMYAEADTAVIRVANTEVLISSYSPNKKVTAKEIADNVRAVLMAQKEYLGGKLPVDKYAFIFYFTDKPVTSYGALEHSYSSMYYMPETTIGMMRQQLRNFVAHEFFHIVTPLTIHSEEIDKFDFNKPRMSQHLWLYEGVTEYFAGNVQVKYGLITQQQYLTVLRDKMLNASSFKDDVVFTDFSRNVLDQGDYFVNVYQKGALIGMCLDLKLRQLSKGDYGLQNLILELSRKYGKSRPFDDNELFGTIERMTYPEIGEFLRKHVGGSSPLPLGEVLSLAGVSYTAEKSTRRLSLGITNKAHKVSELDGKPMLSIGDIDALDDQGKQFGFQNDDIVVAMNGTALPDVGPSLMQFIGQQQASLKEGETFVYTVKRKSTDGKYESVDLKATLTMIGAVEKHIISFTEGASEEQLRLREGWLSAK